MRQNNVLRIGTILADRYQIDSVLACGGSGIIYLANHIRKNKFVVIKESYPSSILCKDINSMLEKENIVQFEKENVIFEIRVMEQLKGIKGIVQIDESFQENNAIYIVMEYLRGKNLGEYVLSQNGKIKFEEAVYVLYEVLKILERIHKKKILHCDISPGNIFICDDGFVKLIDFGSSCCLRKQNEEQEFCNIKEGFAAPEQYNAKRELNKDTDLYGLSATIYYALSGVIPVTAKKREKKDTIVPLNVLQTDLPELFCYTIMKALSLNPKDRFRDVRSYREMVKKGCLKKVKILKEDSIKGEIVLYLFLISILGSIIWICMWNII